MDETPALVCLMLTVAACAMPPPPPPPPPPVYLVFFDWSSAIVGPSGREVIKLAADGFRAGAPVTVQVTGFTDTSGSADYNQRLSGRRAGAVAAWCRTGCHRTLSWSPGAARTIFVYRRQMASESRKTPRRDC